jgi:glycosyltransferase domain-containing protein
MNESRQAPAVTLLIPTMNRPEFVARLLRYYASVGFTGRISIGDSSGPQGVSAAREAVTSVGDTLDVEYAEYPGLGLGDCWKRMIDRLTTPYAAYLADDDFLVPAAVDRCVRFLAGHPDYSAAHGAGVGVTLDTNGLFGNVVVCDYYEQTVSEAESASERLRRHLERYTVTLFAVHRAETWRAMFSDVQLIKDMSFGGELLPCCLSVVYGKVKELDGLYVVRQSHGRRYEQPTMFDWIATPAWFAGYEVTREVLARELAVQERLPVEATRKIVQEGFRYYVGRGMGLRSQWTNGSALVSVARTLWHTWQRMQPKPHSEFALDALLKPSSPYHADFVPVYQSLTTPPPGEEERRRSHAHE